MDSLFRSLTAIAYIFSIAGGLAADDKKEKEEAAEVAVTDPTLVFQTNFEDQKPGDVPSSYFVLDGEWSVVEIDGGKAMKLSETPLVEAQVQVGDSFKEIGGMVKARIKAEKKRRSFPRFGVGMHGMNGYRLRFFPAQQRLELVKSEEVVQSFDLEWTAGEWWFLELTVKPAGDAWTVSGRAWPESGARPGEAQIEYISTETKFSGKASVTGTAYAGLPIYFDDIEVRTTEVTTPAAKPE
jgi:hypothetical protein